MKNLKKIVAVLLSMTAIASTTAFAATEATYEDGTASLVLAEGDITAAANDQLTVVIVPKAADSINSGNIYYINQGAFGEEFAAILADMKVKDGYDETVEYEVRIGGTKVDGEYDVVRFDIAVAEDEVIILYGDVFKDDKVNARDRATLNQRIGGKITDDDIWFDAADLYKDTKINARDRALLNQLLGGKLSQDDFPQGA